MRYEVRYWRNNCVTKEKEELHQQVTAPRTVIYMMLPHKRKMWLQGIPGPFCPSRKGLNRMLIFSWGYWWRFICITVNRSVFCLRQISLVCISDLKGLKIPGKWRVQLLRGNGKYLICLLWEKKKGWRVNVLTAH